MFRTQIQLTEEQARRVKRLARERNTSMAEIIRNAVDQFAADDPRGQKDEIRKRALSAAGKFRSGKKDVARNHDKYLAGDFSK